MKHGSFSEGGIQFFPLGSLRNRFMETEKPRQQRLWGMAEAFICLLTPGGVVLSTSAWVHQLTFRAPQGPLQVPSHTAVISLCPQGLPVCIRVRNLPTLLSTGTVIPEQ